jgi:hypothetical protein
MIVRATLLAAAAIVTAAAAYATIAPVTEIRERSNMNITVVPKNQAFPVYGPIVVAPCATEDCAEPST